MYEITIRKACEGWLPCFSFSDWVQVIILIISVIAIIISISSLNHTKRASLVKDSYEPILDEIKLNEKVVLHSTDLFTLKFLEGIEDNYVYNALNKKQRKYISLINQMTDVVNDYKKNLSELALVEFTNVINERLKKENPDNLLIGDITVENSNLTRIYNVDFFELFIGGKAYERIYFDDYQLVCSMGVDALTSFIDEDGEDVYIDQFQNLEYIFIYDIILQYFNDDSQESNLSNYGMNLTDDFFKKMNTILTNHLEESSEWKDYVKNYQILIENIANLKKDINETIKNLLIPYYWLRKLPLFKKR